MTSRFGAEGAGGSRTRQHPTFGSNLGEDMLHQPITPLHHKPNPGAAAKAEFLLANYLLGANVGQRRGVWRDDD